jgi:hypothetical protein
MLTPPKSDTYLSTCDVEFSMTFGQILTPSPNVESRAC